jgi:SSS family solute:Na+ symporter
LVAAVSSSLSSMSNSISTLFTLDLYKQLINKNASESKLVLVGRLTASFSMVFAVLMAEPFIGKSDQAFQVVQEFTGFFTPGIVLIFLLGFFWKRANATSALVAILSSFFLSIIFKIYLPGIPFIDRVGLVFLVALFLSITVTFLTTKSDNEKSIDLKGIEFKTGLDFNLASLGVFLILLIIYSIYW